MTTVLKEYVDMLMDIYNESLKDIKEIGTIKRLTIEEGYNLYIVLDADKGVIQVPLGFKEFAALIEYGQENGSFNAVFKKMHEKVKKYAFGIIHDFSSADAIIEKIR